MYILMNQKLFTILNITCRWAIFKTVIHTLCSLFLSKTPKYSSICTSWKVIKCLSNCLSVHKSISTVHLRGSTQTLRDMYYILRWPPYPLFIVCFSKLFAIWRPAALKALLYSGWIPWCSLYLPSNVWVLKVPLCPSCYLCLSGPQISLMGQDLE